MDGFSRRQRRLGAVFLALWALIYATIPLVPFLNRTLARFGLATPLWLSLYGTFIAVVGGLVWSSRTRQGPRSLLVLAGVVAAGGIVAWQLDQPARGLHLAGYGALGALGFRLLSESLSSTRAALLTLVIVGLIGWGDEGIQWMVPRRVYSLVDVALNGTAALMGVFVAAVWPGANPGGGTSSAPKNPGMATFGLVALILLTGAPAEARTVRSWPTMGTWAEVVVEASGETTERRGAADVRAVFERVDRTLSSYRENSDLRRINRAADEGPVAVDPWVARIIRRGRAFERITGGAFSMNVPGPRGPGGMESLRRGDRGDRTGMAGPIRVHEDPPRVQLTRPGMALDAGGIAKGWALDRAADALRARGVHRYLVRLGRSVMVGAAPRGNPAGWPVGLPGEPEPRRIVHQSIAVSRQPADTKAHLLDPRSGRPVPAGRWALVSARKGWVADAASTALAVEPTLTRRLMRTYPSIRWSRVEFGSTLR